MFLAFFAIPAINWNVLCGIFGNSDRFNRNGGVAKSQPFQCFFGNIGRSAGNARIAGSQNLYGIYMGNYGRTCIWSNIQVTTSGKYIQLNKKRSLLLNNFYSVHWMLFKIDQCQRSKIKSKQEDVFYPLIHLQMYDIHGTLLELLFVTSFKFPGRHYANRKCPTSFAWHSYAKQGPFKA